MMNNQPRLSIGLPVYNGEKFLKQALDSLLCQTFADFELIISDNASTDNTEEICRTYAAKDQRIRYYRNQTNLGCAINFNRVFKLSSAEYFKWAAHDDLHAPDFLEKCIEILDNNPSVVLCHSHTSLINKNGEFIRNYDIKLKTDSPKPHERFHELLTKHLCYQCYGVIRSSALKKTPLMGSYGSADGILLLRLGLLGKFYEIPEYLFFARTHPQQSMSMFSPKYLLFTNNNAKYSLNMLPDYYLYTVWFDSSKKGKILFPHWRILGEYIISLWQAPINLSERIHCHISMYKQSKGTEYLLIKDLLIAAAMLWKRCQKLSIFKQHNNPLNQ